MSSISFFSGFSSHGIDAVNKKMSVEEIARIKRQQTGQTQVSDKFSQSIDLSNVQKLDTSIADARKLTGEEAARFEKAREKMYSRITNLDELQNHVSQKPYAEVKVGDQVIATIYNGGTSMTSNAYGGKINDIIEKLGSKLTGPEGAQERAEAIARAFGGQVILSDTAVTQAEYIATPPFEPKYEIDYAAMERDLQVALGYLASPQTATDVKTISLSETSETAGLSAKEEFLKFQSMSWEEKVRAMILKSMGLKEEDLDAMGLEEREKIEAKIKEKIEEEIEKKTGMDATPVSIALQG